MNRWPRRVLVMPLGPARTASEMQSQSSCTCGHEFQDRRVVYRRSRPPENRSFDAGEAGPRTKTRSPRDNTSARRAGWVSPEFARSDDLEQQLVLFFRHFLASADKVGQVLGNASLLDRAHWSYPPLAQNLGLRWKRLCSILVLLRSGRITGHSALGKARGVRDV